MTKPRARWPNGSMANCLQASPHATQIKTHVPTQPNSSFPEDNDNTTDSLDDSPGQPMTKRKRGPSKPYIDWGTNTKLIVQLNSYNQPIGETASKLESQLGVIARNAIYCPITYTDWRCKGIDKERIWKDVQDNCEVSKAYKENCLMSVGDKWRKWRGRLTKEHYSIFDNDEDRIANVPRGVDSDQWKLFVQYKGTDMAKQISDAQSPQHQSVDSSEFLFDVGMKVQLLNVGLPKKVVAEGRIISQDPEKKLAGVPIGDGFWEVHITKAILPNEDLLIGRGKMRKVGHAIKQNVPWRKLDVKMK